MTLFAFLSFIFWFLSQFCLLLHLANHKSSRLRVFRLDASGIQFFELRNHATAWMLGAEKDFEEAAAEKAFRELLSMYNIETIRKIFKNNQRL